MTFRLFSVASTLLLVLSACAQGEPTAETTTSAPTTTSTTIATTTTSAPTTTTSEATTTTFQALPDEPIVAVDGEGRVTVLDPNTGEPSRVLMEGVGVDDPAENGIGLAPDGERVFVTVPGAPAERPRLVAITLEGDQQPTEIAQGSAPAVSPDGRTLAYVSFEADTGHPEPVIVLHDLEGNDPDRRLAGVDPESTPTFIADLAWTSDGSGLAYVAGEIQTGLYLLDVDQATDLADASPLGPKARQEGSSWYAVAAFGEGLAVAERCCDVPAERHVTLLLSLDPLEVEGPLLPEDRAVWSLSSDDDSGLVYVTDLTPGEGGTLYGWDGTATESTLITDGIVVADG